MWNFQHGQPAIANDTDIFPFVWTTQHMGEIGQGLPFSLCLLSILMGHEFGHYFNCRRHSVATSFPYVMPAPTLIGTAGAVIKMRSRIKSRQALLDIGISGPLWGFAVAVPWLVVGVLLSKPLPTNAPAPMVWLQNPAIVHVAFRVLRMLHQSVPPLDQTLFHPVLLATWIGLLITSVNLLPAGQLDGGHILYSVSPRGHRYATHIVILLMIVAAIFYWLPWLVWAVLLMMPLMKHQPVPVLPEPDETATAKYVAAAVIFLLTFHYMPFIGYQGDKTVQFSLSNLPQILGH